MSRARHRLAGLAAAFAAAGLCACGGGAADKAGGSASPVTLRMGTPDEPARPGSGDVERFAARVRELSDGRIRIKIAWEAGGRDVPRREQRVAEQVRAGTLDAALVPARTWDLEGVTSLRALQAPFLITSEPLVERVLKSPLAGEMLAGLDRAGVTGLVLLPESLRHPFGFGHALRTPADFAAATIQSPPSDASYLSLRVLGARPVFLRSPTLVGRARAGAVAGVESSFQQAGSLQVASIATGNATLFPKVNALVANRRTFASLTDDQRAILRRAAADTLHDALRTAMPDANAAAEYCRNGGTVVAASNSELSALVRAARRAYAPLEADATTKRLIERIRALKRDVAAPAPALCRAAAGSEKPVPAATITKAGNIPNGIYRKEVTEAQLLAIGIGKTEAFRNYGIQTLTLKDGRWRTDTRSRANLEPCGGVYTHSGPVVTLRGGCADDPWTFNWKWLWQLADGNLYITVLNNDNAFVRLMFGTPWRKIG